MVICRICGYSMEFRDLHNHRPDSVPMTDEQLLELRRRRFRGETLVRYQDRPAKKLSCPYTRPSVRTRPAQ